MSWRNEPTVTTRNAAGLRFIEHVRRVAAQMHDNPDDRAVVAALLHNTVEKGSLEWDDLRQAGAEDQVIAVVDATAGNPPARPPRTSGPLITT
jgi:(p)ppGpp synthase/HD superfamily hydrolase